MPLDARTRRHATGDLDRVRAAGDRHRAVRPHRLQALTAAPRTWSGRHQRPDQEADLTDPQRWVVDFGQEQTTIASYKNLDEVLQGNGVDTPVTLVPANKAPNQIWSLYDK